MGDDIEKLIERAKAHQAGMRPADPQLVSDLLAALEEWKSAAEDELRRRRNLAASLQAAEAERDCACKDAQAERFHLLQAEAERDEAIKARNEAVRLMCETSAKLGEMEGKYKAAHWPGIVDDWIKRCKAAEAERDALKARVGEYRKRLEIDHVWQMQGEGGDLVRVDLNHDDTPDGISCRDETIRLLNERIEGLSQGRGPKP